MFCTQCGNQIPDGSTFCPFCGAALTQQPAPVSVPQPEPTYQQASAYQPQAYEQAPAYQQAPAYDQNAYQQTYQQAPAAVPAFQQAPAQQAAAPKGNVMATPLKPFAMPNIKDLFVGYNKDGVAYAESTGLKMKWYKALTAALLYLSAISFLYYAIQYTTGLIYGDSAGYYYMIFPALKVLDVIYGIYFLALIPIILYIRMHLAQFSSDGPKLYLLLLLFNTIVGVVYTLLTCIIIRNFDALTITASVGVGLAMFVLNRTYFDKRQHLFTM